MHRITIAFLMALTLTIGMLTNRAHAASRLALVVGNGAYSTVTPLDNPVRDAELMADALREVGFEVTLVTNSSQNEMITAISNFGSRLRTAGEDATGLFYYAGHGVQSFGTNFLLPVDIELQDAADLSLVGVPAQAVLRQMFSARNRTNIVILDACRNNPFVTIPDLRDNGLAEMKAPRGTFLAYSTAPGDVALDGVDGNSPFTEALARHMQTPGMSVETLFREVRIDVLKDTNNQQTPWDTSSLTVDFQFLPAKAPTQEEVELRQIWDSVKLSNDPLQVLLFLRAHPDSRYSGEARKLLTVLMEKEAQPVASAKAPPQAASEPAAPQTSEREMIETARRAGTASAYQTYLDAYPNGAFAELARLEQQTILNKEQSKDPVATQPPPEDTPVATQQPATTKDQKGPPAVIAFNAPLAMGTPDIASRSISELITGSPKFPPIEGLPEAVWKDKTCAACHHWEQANLCDQAKTYVADKSRAVAKEHPYGGVFKNALRLWAEQGCP
ncbi:peptidase C14, caspase catalytic subunit p20 [Stappia sp. BW2]|uniref:caspase family protein n=1 Tax=Stappia sp. BW2 TaxID=2592622 RepID=UPI0011DE957B|nr:caspase family protein [Stappia sp. BW2]TYC67585.1 peptidase C14, caspase catalytic subunit p20 [Stappia sp. BW2]